MATTGIGKCVICGKWFHNRSKRRQILCSEPCRRERERQRQRGFRPIEGKCVICGKTFRRKVGLQICCSRSCSKERNRITRHKSYTLHSSKAIEQARQWAINNPEAHSLNSKIAMARYRAGPAMPPWVDRGAIRRIYAECPKDKIIDHIIGLAKPHIGHTYFEGRPVCGLHVPWNLQCITQSENISKQDKHAKKLITHDSITDTLAGWSRRTRIPYSRLARRLLDGWSVERTLTEHSWGRSMASK